MIPQRPTDLADAIAATTPGIVNVIRMDWTHDEASECSVYYNTHHGSCSGRFPTLIHPWGASVASLFRTLRVENILVQFGKGLPAAGPLPALTDFGAVEAAIIDLTLRLNIKFETLRTLRGCLSFWPEDAGYSLTGRASIINRPVLVARQWQVQNAHWLERVGILSIYFHFPVDTSHEQMALEARRNQLRANKESGAP